MCNVNQNTVLNDADFKTFVDALNGVGAEYMNFTFQSDELKKNQKKDELQHCERVFAYEFYRQWANKLENSSQDKLNAEISKKGGIAFPQINSKKFPEKIKAIILYNKKKKEKKKKVTWYPDLVLHSNQGNTENGHKIVCEIKRSDYAKGEALKHDLEKLLCFTSKYYLRNNIEDKDKSYKFGIMLIFGGKIEEVERNIKKAVYDCSDLLKTEGIDRGCVYCVIKPDSGNIIITSINDY